jgi:carbon storage regulator
MLVLQRKKNEALLIGSEIEIMITEIKGDSVKLGIKAPKSVSIYRKEVYELIQKQNLAASEINKDDLDRIAELLKKKAH